jgi:hypothetical protein
LKQQNPFAMMTRLLQKLSHMLFLDKSFAKCPIKF